MKKYNTIVNPIPVQTWNWLGVNGTKLENEIPAIGTYKKQPLKISNSAVSITKLDQQNQKYPVLNELNAGLNEELQEFVQANQNSGFCIEIAADDQLKEPMLLQYELDDQDKTLVDHHLILAHKNSEATIVIGYQSTDESKGFHNGITQVYAEQGAIVHLVKVQMLSDQDIHLDAIGVFVESDAQVDITTVELGAAQTITSCKTNLAGDNSVVQVQSIYFGDKERKLDMNYVVSHQGKKSIGTMEIHGALMDKSQKTFRGTLDFLKGSRGAVGNEAEEIVLLSPNVRNRSVPLMLSGESDVEGHHAVSIGKMDEDKLFYLMSRGLSLSDAEKLVVEASFQPALDKIPVPEIKTQISTYIRRRLSDAE
jgi:hypothetical protein